MQEGEKGELRRQDESPAQYFLASGFSLDCGVGRAALAASTYVLGYRGECLLMLVLLHSQAPSLPLPHSLSPSLSCVPSVSEKKENRI